jgi:phospholipid-binding lipoprotein MlaA
MRVKLLSGVLLIAALLLAVPAWAEGDLKEGTGTGDTGQITLQDNETVRSEAPASATGTGEVSEKAVEKKDVFAKYDEIQPQPDAAPETETTQDAGSPDEAVESPNEENAPSDEEVVPDEAKPEEAIEDTTIADPLEPINRAMFHFNDKLYFWFLKPIAKGYNFVVPEPVRVSVRDFFRNASMPVRFVGSLFQGKITCVGTELSRFSINTILGLAGFFDVAKSWFNLNPCEEDLGQTLGLWGMGGMIYIVWPFIGPSTVRDTLGMAGDSFLDPFNYINPFYIPLGIHTYDRINRTSLDLKTYEDLVEQSLEPYIAVRDAYIQNRNELIRK